MDKKYYSCDFSFSIAQAAVQNWILSNVRLCALFPIVSTHEEYGLLLESPLMQLILDLGLLGFLWDLRVFCIKTHKKTVPCPVTGSPKLLPSTSRSPSSLKPAHCVSQYLRKIKFLILAMKIQRRALLLFSLCVWRNVSFSLFFSLFMKTHIPFIFIILFPSLSPFLFTRKQLDHMIQIRIIHFLEAVYVVDQDALWRIHWVFVYIVAR